MSVTIEWRADGVSMDELLSRISDRRRAFNRWGLSVADAAKRSALSHSKGGGFWTSIADHVRVAAVDADSALVICDHFAARQKQYGGKIRAKNAAALTIPIHELAKGKRARDMALSGFDIFRPPGTNILAMRTADGGLIPLYALVRETRPQAAEPWWPTVEEVAAIGAAIMTAMITKERR